MTQLKKEEVDRSKIRKEINEKIRIRDKYKCHFCSVDIRKVSLSNTIHHIIPYNLGGEDSIDNCITICKNCHVKLEIIYRKLLKYLLKNEFVMTNMHGLELKNIEKRRLKEAELKGRQEMKQEILKEIDSYLKLLKTLKPIKYDLDFILLQFKELKSKIKKKK